MLFDFEINYFEEFRSLLLQLRSIVTPLSFLGCPAENNKGEENQGNADLGKKRGAKTEVHGLR